MKPQWMLVAMLLLPATAFAQSSLPAGTILPLSLNQDLNADRVHADQQISAKVMQDIPGTQIRRGTEVLGHIVSVTSSRSGESQVEFRFDSIKIGGQRIPLKANLRALASPAEISDADWAMYGPDAGIDFNSVSTNQIGGELVFRGGGPVFNGSTVIGKSTSQGVLAEPRSNTEQHCRGVVAGNATPQALWLFSSDACGLYGFDSVRIQHAGRSAPFGQIVLDASKGRLNINKQSGLLLRIQGS